MGEGAWDGYRRETDRNRETPDPDPDSLARPGTLGGPLSLAWRPQAMKLPSTLVIVIAFALLAGIPVSSHATGQAAAASAPVAINPMYTAQASALTTDQVASMQQQLADWPQLGRYRADNAQLAPPAPDQARVVFYGDSITDLWG